MERLPAEILLKILNELAPRDVLGVVRMVSRKFYAIVSKNRDKFGFPKIAACFVGLKRFDPETFIVYRTKGKQKELLNFDIACEDQRIINAEIDVLIIQYQLPATPNLIKFLSKIYVKTLLYAWEDPKIVFRDECKEFSTLLRGWLTRKLYPPRYHGVLSAGVHGVQILSLPSTLAIDFDKTSSNSIRIRKISTEECIEVLQVLEGPSCVNFTGTIIVDIPKAQMEKIRNRLSQDENWKCVNNTSFSRRTPYVNIEARLPADPGLHIVVSRLGDFQQNACPAGILNVVSDYLIYSPSRYFATMFFM
ncbi:unnamed protein product, partial [Mesorhabditis spiculigera]